MKIRELKECDAKGMLEWLSDPRTRAWSRIDPQKQTLDSVMHFIRSAGNDASAIHRAIVDETDIYQGTVSLKNIDMDLRAAEYAISMRIGSQGTGAAKFGTIEILKYAFESLSLERVYWYVFSDNQRANSFYEKMGFTLEGEFRKALKVNGIVHDVKWYSILREEFYEWLLIIQGEK